MPGRSSVAVRDIAPIAVPKAFIPTSGRPEATTGAMTDAIVRLVDPDRDAVDIGGIPLFLVHEERAVDAVEEGVGAAFEGLTIASGSSTT